MDRVVPATSEKQIELVTLAKKEDSRTLPLDEKADLRHKIAKRAAKEIKDGFYVNLGIGMPMLAPNFLPEGVSVTLQSGIPCVDSS